MKLSNSRHRAKPLLVDAVNAPRIKALQKHKKRGFSLAHESWIRGPLKDDVLANMYRVAENGYVKRDKIDSLWNAFANDRHGSLWNRVWTMSALGNSLRSLDT